MPVRIEFHHVPHPFKLCFECNEKLGDNCITLDPGNPKMKQLFTCGDCFGNVLKQIGDSIIRMIDFEKGNGND